MLTVAESLRNLALMLVVYVVLVAFLRYVVSAHGSMNVVPAFCYRIIDPVLDLIFRRALPALVFLVILPLGAISLILIIGVIFGAI